MDWRIHIHHVNWVFKPAVSDLQNTIEVFKRSSPFMAAEESTRTVYYKDTGKDGTVPNRIVNCHRVYADDAKNSGTGNKFYSVIIWDRKARRGSDPEAVVVDYDDDDDGEFECNICMQKRNTEIRMF